MPFLGKTSSLARLSDMATIVGWTKTMSYTLGGSIFEMISACSASKTKTAFFKHTQPALSDNKSTLINAFDLIELIGDDIRRDRCKSARPRGRSLKSNSYHAATAERTETIACSRGRARRAPRSEVSEARDRSGP
jgi:hypothetical protein